MAAVSNYSKTGNAYIDGLLGVHKWSNANLTFSFPAQASFYGGNYGDGEPTDNFAPLNATQQGFVRWALNSYASVANFTFTELQETSNVHATLRFAMSDAPYTAWAYMPDTAPEGGDSWYSRSGGWYSTPVKGNYAAMTFVHEIGHALGLEHAHEYYQMPMNRDSMEYTVMSYRSYIGGSTASGYSNENWGFAQSLMMLDIAALQHLVGANFASNAGDTAYSWSPVTGQMFINGAGQGAPGANRIFQTVWDGGGTDTYDLSNYASSVTIDLRPGYWTTTSVAQLAKLTYSGSQLAAGNIGNALQYNGDPRSLIENAKGGSAGDIIVGNAADNILYGLGGNDSLFAGSGNDLLFGGTGADVLYGGAGADTAYYSLAAATNTATGAGLIIDLLYPGANTGEAAGDSYNSIENLVASLHHDSLRGDNAANMLQGLGGDDTLYGKGGNDHLLGGAGADRLDGGAGVDSANYALAAATDVQTGAGLVIDLLYPGANTGEAAGDTYFSIETLFGSKFHDSVAGDHAANVIQGYTGDDALYGRGGNDQLYGGDGDDVLVGGGGGDWLYGGAGSDSFVFWHLSESWPGARDTIWDFVSGVDMIDLYYVDADSVLAGDQAFDYIGGAAFTGAAGQLNFMSSLLSGDVNGDGIADFQVNVHAVTSLSYADFLV